jgi:hypothetical protein
MNLTLHLTPETEARLKEQAAHSGKSLERVVLEAIEAKLANEPENSETTPYEAWKVTFNELMSSMPQGDVGADFSRESIYEGRGE